MNENLKSVKQWILIHVQWEARLLKNNFAIFLIILIFGLETEVVMDNWKVTLYILNWFWTWRMVFYLQKIIYLLELEFF